MLNPDAIRCQIDAIAKYAIKNDAQKLLVRAALRDALDRLERKECSDVTKLESNRRLSISPAKRSSDGGDAK